MRYTVIHISTFIILVGVFTRQVCSRHASREVVEDRIKDTKKKINTPYEFGYEIHDQNGNKQHRHESSDADGVRRGSYGYVDANGVYRKVEYIADKNGFRVKEMKSNEPGFDSKEKPADVVKLKNPETNLITSSNRVKNTISPKEREVNNYKVLATMKHRPLKSSDSYSNDSSAYSPPISSFIESPKFKSAGQSDNNEYDSYVTSKNEGPGQSSYTVPIYQDVKGGRKSASKQYPTKSVLIDYSKKGKPAGSGEYMNEPIDGYTLLKAIETKPKSKTNELDNYIDQKYHFEPVRINSRPPIQSEYQHTIEPDKPAYVVQTQGNRHPVTYEVHRYPTTERPQYPTSHYPTYPPTQYPTTHHPPSHYPPATNYPTTTSYTPSRYPSTQYSTTNQYPSTSSHLPPPPYMATTYSNPPPPTSRPSYSSLPPPYSPSSSYSSGPPYPRTYDAVAIHPYPDTYSQSTVKKTMAPSVFYADESSGIDERYPVEPPVDTSSYYSPHRSGNQPPEPPEPPSLRYGMNPMVPTPASSPRRGSWYDAIRSSRPSTLTTPRDTIPSVILGIQVALQADHPNKESLSASSWNASSSLPSHDSDQYNPSHYPSHHQIMLLRRGLGKLIPLLHKKDVSNSLTKNAKLTSSASDRNQVVNNSGDLEPSASRKLPNRDTHPVYRD